MNLKSKKVIVYEPDENKPHREELIPVLDGGVRGSCSTRFDSRGKAYGDAQFAFEREIDAHIRDFMVALMPYVEWLKEIGDGNYTEHAINAALTRRNSMLIEEASRVEGAKRMSKLVPRYRALADAAKAHGAEVEVHTYSEFVVNIIHDRSIDSCVHIRPGGYDPGWSDGYHVNESGLSLDPNQAVIEALKIAKETREGNE